MLDSVTLFRYITGTLKNCIRAGAATPFGPFCCPAPETGKETG